MSTPSLRYLLLWCSVVNYALLIFWALITPLLLGRLRPLYVRWYGVDGGQLAAVNLAGIIFYKVAIILFNVIPCVILYVLGAS